MSGARARLARAATSTWTLGAIVFALTWGGGMEMPYTPPSLDFSMHAAFNMAAVEGLDFGTDLVFTYGPLGFLKSYLVYYEWPARLAALYGIALHLALSLTVVWAIRRNYGTVIAVALGIVIAALARGDELAVGVRDDAAVVIVAFAWSVAALGHEAPDLARRLVVFGGGSYAAIEVLAKLNTGLLVLAVVVIAAAAIDGRRVRNLGIVAGSFTGTLAVLWFAAGQGVSNFVDFLDSGFEIIAGYSSGAGFEWNDHGYDYWLAPLLVGAALTIAWFATRGLDRPRRTATLAIVALVGLAAAKTGLAVHDIFHMATSYAILAGVLCLLPQASGTRPRVAALAGTAAAIIGATTTFTAFYPMDDPIDNLGDGVSTIATMLDEGRLDDQIADNRAHLQNSYALDARTLEALDGRSVHVDPSETSVVWAYGLEWRPLPVFQPYAVWTADLDALNAQAVADPAGPERILRQNLDALGRYPGFESPAAMLAMLCHFEPLRTTPSWEVLGRVEDRCGEPRALDSRTAAFGEPIPIPKPPRGHVVFAIAEGLDVEGLERLRTAVLRSHGRQVVFEGDAFTYNLIPGTSGDGLLLAAAPGTDYPEPYSLAPRARTVTFMRDDEPDGRPITLDFYAMPVRRVMHNPRAQ